MTHHAHPAFPAKLHNQSHPLVSPGFGARLVRARLAAGYDSQPKLARAAGLSVNTICRHETEAYPPSLGAMLAYCHVLNVPAAFLQYGVGDPNVPHAVNHYLCSYKGQLLLPETRSRLIALPWSLVVDGDPTEPQVHAIARVVDQNLRLREHRPDGFELPGGYAEVSDGAGPRHERRRQKAAIGA